MAYKDDGKLDLTETIAAYFTVAVPAALVIFGGLYLLGWL